jgi:hypothetical protein
MTRQPAQRANEGFSFVLSPTCERWSVSLSSLARRAHRELGVVSRLSSGYATVTRYPAVQFALTSSDGFSSIAAASVDTDT